MRSMMELLKRERKREGEERDIFSWFFPLRLLRSGAVGRITADITIHNSACIEITLYDCMMLTCVDVCIYNTMRVGLYMYVCIHVSL